MKLLILLSCTFFFASCSNNNTKPSEKKVSALIIGEPIDYENSALMIFPVGNYNGSHVFYDDKLGTAEFRYSNVNFFHVYDKTVNGMVTKEYSNYSNDNYSVSPTSTGETSDANSTRDEDQATTDVRNLIFYNRKTGEKYKLNEAGLHITNFSFHSEFKKELIMYKIIQSDYNNDSVHNNADGVVLFISDKDGKNFLQVSPDSAQYIDYKYYDDTNMLLVRSLRDSNHDHRFDMNDEFLYTKVDLVKPGKGTELFDKSFTDNLRAMVK
jgi:hypothetical protein